MKRIANTLLAVMAFVGIGATTAQAQVVNGGFEGGNAGWNLNANDCSGPVGDPNASNGYLGAYGGEAHSGSNAMWFGASGCLPSISQTLTDVAGQAYELKYWLKLTSSYALNVPNLFEISVNGGPALYSAELSNTDYAEYSVSFVGTGSDVIALSGQNTNGGTVLDDVSLVVATPEPASLALVATGVVGLGASIRRRRRKSA